MNKRAHNFKDLTGQVFERLRVIEYSHKGKHRRAFWKCQCSCGKITYVQSGWLLSGNTKSCGCLNLDNIKTHGKSYERIYRIWNGMISRCYRNSHKHYDRYGGRGIKICNEWMNFLKFEKWAVENGYKNDLTIHRKNNDSDYEPTNCIWTTRKIQSRHTSTNKYINYNNKIQCISAWAEEFKINQSILSARLRSGWDFEKALKTPVRKRTK